MRVDSLMLLRRQPKVHCMLFHSTIVHAQEALCKKVPRCAVTSEFAQGMETTRGHFVGVVAWRIRS